MPFLKRHKSAIVSAVLLTLILATGTVLLMLPGRSLATEDGAPAVVPPRDVDPVVYCQIRDARDRLSLTGVDLAMLGCDADGAQRVLGAMRNWFETNQERRLAAEKDERDALMALRETRRRIAVGPRDGTVMARLPEQNAALSTARAALSALDQELDQVVLAQLAVEQRDRLQAARAAGPLPPEIRFLPTLTKEQKAQVAQQLSKGQEVSPAVAQAIQTQRVLLGEKMPVVLSCEEQVLPMPAALVPAIAPAEQGQ